MEAKEIPAGYELTTIEIKNEKVVAYQNEENVLVYGVNIASGNKSFYRYDKEEQTFQRYSVADEKMSNNYLYLIIALGSVCGLLLILLIIVGSNSSKKTKLIKRFEEVANSKGKKKKVEPENIIEEKKKK